MDLQSSGGMIQKGTEGHRREQRYESTASALLITHWRINQTGKVPTSFGFPFVVSNLGHRNLRDFAGWTAEYASKSKSIVFRRFEIIE